MTFDLTQPKSVGFKNCLHMFICQKDKIATQELVYKERTLKIEVMAGSESHYCMNTLILCIQ